MRLTIISIFAYLSLTEANRLLLVNLGGFRWDYIHRLSANELPTFYDIISSGSYAEWVEPVFPARSLPSWTTIVTGLYPESHGIIGDYMYDRVNDVEFNPDLIGQPDDTTLDPKWWQDHEPLWITAEKSGKKATLYQWSYCQVPFTDAKLSPSKCEPYDEPVANSLEAFESNLEKALTDLNNGYDLAMVYTGAILQCGYDNGPDTRDTIKMIISLDKRLGNIRSRLPSDVNLVIISDHGMATWTDLPSKELTKLSLNTNDLVKVVERGPFTHIALRTGANVSGIVDTFRTEWPQMKVYPKENVPDKYHFRNNDLILDLVLVSWGTNILVADNDLVGGIPDEVYLPRKGSERSVNGGVGFDDVSLDANGYEQGAFHPVRGIFMADGPSFQSGHKNDWIKLVDQYQMYTTVLGLTGNAHNGTWSRVAGMLT